MNKTLFGIPIVETDKDLGDTAVKFENPKDAYKVPVVNIIYGKIRDAVSNGELEGVFNIDNIRHTWKLDDDGYANVKYKAQEEE